MKLAFCAVGIRDRRAATRRAVEDALAPPDGRVVVDIPGLVRSPARYRAPDGWTHLGLWSRTGARLPSSTPSRCAWSSGHPLPTGADPLDQVVQRTPVDELPWALSGAYAVIRATATGIHIAPDPAGFEVVYTAETPAVAVASNRPELVVAVLASVGSPPSPDVRSACLLAHGGFPDGQGGPYEGVQRLPPWSWCEVDAAHGVTVRARVGPPPWRTAAGTIDDRDLERALDEAKGALLGAVRHAAEVDAGLRVLDVTGGRDTRLVLAAVHDAGLGDRFVHRTIGDPDLADVVRAGEVCAHLGVPHASGFRVARSPVPFPARMSGFVAATHGRANAFDLHDVGCWLDEARLQGGAGEVLRSGLLEDAHRLRPESVAGHLARTFRPDEPPLLQPSARAEAERRFLADVAARPGLAHLDADDIAHDYYVRVRLRARFEQAPLLWPTDCFLPLYTAATMRLRAVGRALGWHPAELHGLLVRRFATDVEAVPYLADRPVRASPGASARPDPALMETLRARQVDARRDAFAQVVDEAGDDAWELLDRHGVVTAVQDMPSLRLPARRRLHGAMTALVWLSQVRRTTSGAAGAA